MVQKIVNTKTKTGLKFNTMVQSLDICCLRNHCPSINTVSKIQTQKTIVKSSCPKEPKTKKTKPTHAKTIKFLEQKIKKKKTKRHRQNATRKQKKTPATGNNTINASKN